MIDLSRWSARFTSHQIEWNGGYTANNRDIWINRIRTYTQNDHFHFGFPPARPLFNYHLYNISNKSSNSEMLGEVKFGGQRQRQKQGHKQNEWTQRN